MVALSLVIAIRPLCVSGICSPSWISRLSGLLKRSSLEFDRAAGFCTGTTLYPVISTALPSVCAYTAPPCVGCALKFTPGGNTNGALTALCCASTAIVDVSKTCGPDTNCDPSGETASTDEMLPRLRERSTVAEFTSNTNTDRE